MIWVWGERKDLNIGPRVARIFRFFRYSFLLTELDMWVGLPLEWAHALTLFFPWRTSHYVALKVCNYPAIFTPWRNSSWFWRHYSFIGWASKRDPHILRGGLKRQRPLISKWTQGKVNSFRDKKTYLSFWTLTLF